MGRLRIERLLRRPALLRAATWQFAGFAAMGVAMLMSTTLPPAARGRFAGGVTSLILASAIGCMSLDTFLPVQAPAGWASFGIKFHRSLLGLTVGASCIAALVLGGIVRADYPVLLLTGAMITALLVHVSATSIQAGGIKENQRARSLGSFTFLLEGAVLLVLRKHSSTLWLTAWELSQALTVAILLCAGYAPLVFRRQLAGVSAAESPPPNLRHTLGTISLIHIGVMAQAITLRMDQVVLGRIAGSSALGIYSLAVAALEASQGPAALFAQRELRAGQSGYRDALRNARVSMRRAGQAAVVVGVGGVAALVIVGKFLAPSYTRASLLGLILLPGIALLSTSKPGSAVLTATGNANAPTSIAVGVGLTSLPVYVLLISFFGATGAAVGSTLLYVLHNSATRLALRRRLQPVTDATYKYGASLV